MLPLRLEVLLGGSAIGKFLNIGVICTLLTKVLARNKCKDG